MRTEWGERACLRCGAKFTAQYIQQIYCGDECKAQARKQQCCEYKKKANKRDREILRAYKEWSGEKEKIVAKYEQEIETLNARIKQLESSQGISTADYMRAKATIRELEDRVSRLTKQIGVYVAQIAELKKKSPPVDPFVAIGKQVHECKRLALRTTAPLPCGTRDECFKPRCEGVPKGATLEKAREERREFQRRRNGAVAPGEEDVYQPQIGQDLFQ